MKKILFLLIPAVTLTIRCYAQSNLPEPTADSDVTPKYDSDWYISNFISFTEAQKIIQQPVYIKDSLWKYSNYNYGYLRYAFTYNAKSMDSITKTRSSLFFSLEQYQQLALAKKTFNDIKALNQKSDKYTALTEPGDEAFLVKDVLAHPFIVIRKGNRIYKLRMLYVTGQIANDELMLLAKKIVAGH